VRAILVDDEVIALDLLEKFIRKISELKIVGKYTNPIKAYEAIIGEKPDIVFLDINMPEMCGMTLAKKVLKVFPEVGIVFVTAHSEYAVEAFEIEAVDYLTKPVNTNRLMKTIERLKIRINKKSYNSPVISCFKTLEFKRTLNHSQIDVNWRTTKARELFAFLVHNRFESVRKDVIIDTLWPETDVKNASTQLYSTVYQIRRTLDQIQFPIEIISTNNQYKIKMNGVRTDVDHMEQGLKNLEFTSKEKLKFYKSLLRLYKGDYLEEDNYHWALSEQNRLRVLWTSYLNEIAGYYLDRRKYAEAIMLYLHYQSIASYNEDIYFKLMQLFEKIGDRKSIEMQYSKLKKMLKEQFDDVPSIEVKQWYKSRIKSRYYNKKVRFDH